MSDGELDIRDVGNIVLIFFLDRTQPVNGSLAKTPLWERPAPDEIQLVNSCLYH